MLDDFVLQTITPVTHDLGGFKVHRTLPSKARTMVGPFLFFDQMGPAHLPAGRGHRRPPASAHQPGDRHLSVRRRDRPPRFARHAPADRAGRGQSDDRGPRHRPFRTLARRRARARARRCRASRPGWRCPRRSEEIDPAFEHVAAGRAADDRGGRRHARASSWARSGADRADHDLCRHDLRRHRARARRGRADRRRPPRSARSISRWARRRSRACRCEPQVLYVLRPGIAATLRSATGGRAMLCGGDAFATKRHVWWNFVSSRPERIQEAKRAWTAGEFPARARRRHEEFDPDPRPAADGELPPASGGLI